MAPIAHYIRRVGGGVVDMGTGVVDMRTGVVDSVTEAVDGGTRVVEEGRGGAGGCYLSRPAIDAAIISVACDTGQL